jgi:hypothetical protein
VTLKEQKNIDRRMSNLSNKKAAISENEKRLLNEREEQFRSGVATEDSWENVKTRLIEKINKT